MRLAAADAKNRRMLANIGLRTVQAALADLGIDPAPSTGCGEVCSVAVTDLGERPRVD